MWVQVGGSPLHAGELIEFNCNQVFFDKICVIIFVKVANFKDQAYIKFSPFLEINRSFQPEKVKLIVVDCVVQWL